MIPYTLVRSNRKTISIVIKPTGEVEVRCPRRCSKRDVEAFLVSKAAWIQGHLEKIAERPAVTALSKQSGRLWQNRLRRYFRPKCSILPQ